MIEQSENGLRMNQTIIKYCKICLNSDLHPVYFDRNKIAQTNSEWFRRGK